MSAVIQYLYILKKMNLFILELCCVAWRIQFPSPHTEPLPPAVEAWSLNPWTTREVPNKINVKMICLKIIYDIPSAGYMSSPQDFPVKKGLLDIQNANNATNNIMSTQVYYAHATYLLSDTL